MARGVLITSVVFLVGVIVVAPVAAVLYYAFSQGLATYLSAIADLYTLRALQLTAIAALIAVPLNALFGLAFAWSAGHFRFRGKRLFLALVDLPLAMSPVISGMLLVLLYGPKGPLASTLAWLDVKIIFAFPGIVLATVFVTLPYVARELTPVVEEQGSAEEQAALTMGATGWQMFFRVTLPKLKWGLLYGVILCSSRAVGEFGAVSVVSGHIRGVTNTLPLHIEVLYNDYKSTQAFAAATILGFVSVNTLLWKVLLEWRLRRRR